MVYLNFEVTKNSNHIYIYFYILNIKISVLFNKILIFKPIKFDKIILLNYLKFNI